MTCSDCILLIISDDLSCADTYQHWLTPNADNAEPSYRVVTASYRDSIYGDSILELCRTHSVRGILLEANATDDRANDRALDLLVQLKAQMGESRPPVIVFGSDQANLAVRSLKAGAVDYLVQDQLTADTLRQAIETAFGAAPLSPPSTSNASTNPSITNPFTQSEALLQAMIENLPGGAVFVVDRDLRYRLAEGEALHAAGFEPKHFIGQTIFEVLPSNLAADYEPQYRQALAGEPFEHEHSAHDRCYISCGTPLRSANGEVYAVLVVSYDITEHKRVEAERQQSEARLQQITNLVPDLLWDSEPNGSTNWHNQRWMEYTGQTFEQAIRWGWVDAIHPDDRAGSARRYQEAVEQGILLQQEHRIRRHDGEYRWFIVKASPLKDESGKVIKMYGAATDIHEQRVALEALRESEAKYRSLFDTIDEGFALAEVIYDSSGQAVDILYLEANPAATRMTGVPDFTRQRLREISPDFESYWFEIYDRVARTGVSERTEYYAAPLKRWYDFYVFPIEAAPGQSPRVAVIFQDISDRKQAEAQLRRAAEIDAFRVKLSDALRSLADPVDIEETVTRIAMHHFGADRCYYCEIEDGNSIIRRDAVCGDLPSVAGVYPLSSFTILQAVIEAGHPFVVQDVRTTDTVDEDLRQICLQMQVISYIDVPVIKHGKPVGALCLVQSTPRDWTELEVELAIETADRTWAAVERARAEEALRRSEGRLRALFESIDEGFSEMQVILDEEGHVVDWLHLALNSNFSRVTGIPDITGRLASEVFPNLEGEWFRRMDLAYRTGEPQRFETELAELGRWFDNYITRLGGEDDNRVFGVFGDITDRKRRERQQEFLLNFSDYLRTLADEKAIEENSLRLLAEFLRLDRAYVFVLYPSEDRAVVRAEQRKENLASLLGEVRMSDFPETVRQIEDQTLVINDIDSDARLSDLNRTSLDAVNLQAFVCASVRKGEGNVIWSLAASTATPRTWTQVEVELIETVAERIWAAVERARAEAALQQMMQKVQALNKTLEQRVQARTAQLEAINQELDAFSYSVSHDLQTPLRYINSFVERLQTKLNTDQADASSLRYLGIIEEAAGQAHKMINDLLQFSRMGKTPLNMAHVAMAELVEQVRSQLEPETIDRSIDWQIEPLPEVQGDPDLLRLVVQNLLSNAVKYTRDLTPATITIGSNAYDHEIVFFVQDNGAGFDMKYQDRLFSLFQRLHSQEQFTGTGVGLANVRRIIHRHGGRVWAEGVVDQGATFYFSLPKQEVMG